MRSAAVFWFVAMEVIPLRMEPIVHRSSVRTQPTPERITLGPHEGVLYRRPPMDDTIG
jgi:hypothetical protein